MDRNEWKAFEQTTLQRRSDEAVAAELRLSVYELLRFKYQGQKKLRQEVVALSEDMRVLHGA